MTLSVSASAPGWMLLLPPRRGRLASWQQGNRLHAGVWRVEAELAAFRERLAGAAAAVATCAVLRWQWNFSTAQPRRPLRLRAQGCPLQGRPPRSRGEEQVLHGIPRGESGQSQCIPMMYLIETVTKSPLSVTVLPFFSLSHGGEITAKQPVKLGATVPSGGLFRASPDSR